MKDIRLPEQCVLEEKSNGIWKGIVWGPEASYRVKFLSRTVLKKNAIMIEPYLNTSLHVLAYRRHVILEETTPKERSIT